VHAFLWDALYIVDWNLPEDGEGVRKVLCEAIANKRLIPVINREYRGLPRVDTPTPRPLDWPNPVSSWIEPKPEIISYIDFVALQRANGELPGPPRREDQVSDDSAQLSDAQAFDYRPGASREATRFAARGVSESQELKCFVAYEADMELCSAGAAM
jgi:hypothetical protein